MPTIERVMSHHDVANIFIIVCHSTLFLSLHVVFFKHLYQNGSMYNYIYPLKISRWYLQSSVSLVLRCEIWVSCSHRTATLLITIPCFNAKNATLFGYTRPCTHPDAPNLASHISLALIISMYMHSNILEL